ncbi:MAG: hypothetical protein IJO70_07595 [Lachnospiraceae bacterium]|nr:hypothetical protein [Lachnospiraceae bacterium]
MVNDRIEELQNIVNTHKKRMLFVEEIDEYTTIDTNKRINRMYELCGNDDEIIMEILERKNDRMMEARRSKEFLMEEMNEEIMNANREIEYEQEKLMEELTQDNEEEIDEE